MKVQFDPDANALFIVFDDAAVKNSAEVSPGIILDYDENDRVVAIEVLHARERVPAEELKRIFFEVA